MAAAVAAALQEPQVVGVLDRRRLRELADRLRQQPREVGHLHPPRDLRLGERASGVLLVWITGSSFSTCCHSKLTSSIRHVEALAVLPGRVEQAARHLGDDVRALDLERRGLDGERAVVLRDQLLADAARAVADDALGRALAEDRQARADAVRRVPHRRQARPVVRASRPCPAGGCRGGTGCGRARRGRTGPWRTGIRGCRRPSPSSCRPCRSCRCSFDDLPALVHRRRHRHRAGDVLAGLQRGDRLRRVVGDRAVDVDGVDVRVLEQLVVVGVARLDAELVAAARRARPCCAGRWRTSRRSGGPGRSG